MKYTVYIYDADGDQIKTASVTNPKVSHGSAKYGMTYSYRVVAVHADSAANSAKSAAVTVTVVEPVPETPTEPAPTDPVEPTEPTVPEVNG